MKTYDVAPMDLFMKIVTLLVCVLTVAFVVWGVVQPAERGTLLVAAFLLILIWTCWQIAPKRYDLTDDSLVIVRGWPFRDIPIPVAKILDVCPVKLSSFTTLRTFGVGGLFSASGWFWNKDIGSFFAEITNGHRTVLIDAGRKYVISPEDPHEFVQDIQTRTTS
ncbi:MAG: hypothetical protein KBC96_05750 [Armatimonadetes bacterium]|nr:hypothetical protein [Armatimonadota bacterium]